LARFGFAAAAVLGCALSLAASLPLTTQDISLMLRSGYSSEAVLRELDSRRYAGEADGDAQKQLIKAGATAALIEALSSGSYDVSPTEAAAAKQRSAVQQQKPEAVAVRGDRAPQSANPGNSAKPTSSRDAKGMFHLLKDDLVYWHNGTLVPLEGDALEQKKVFLLFFSANASRAGRAVTPKLVEYYNRLTAQHPELEIVYFSLDRARFGMETSYAQMRMPWPAVEYSKIDSKLAVLPKDLLREIPCLVLTNAAADLLAVTKPGETDSVDKILAQAEQLLGENVTAR
jgi:hypothetical protein